MRHRGSSARLGIGTLSTSRGPAVAEQQTTIAISPGGTFGSTTTIGRLFSRSSSNAGQLSHQTMSPCRTTSSLGGRDLATGDVLNLRSSDQPHCVRLCLSERRRRPRREYRFDFFHRPSGASLRNWLGLLQHLQGAGMLRGGPHNSLKCWVHFLRLPEYRRPDMRPQFRPPEQRRYRHRRASASHRERQ